MSRQASRGTRNSFDSTDTPPSRRSKAPPSGLGKGAPSASSSPYRHPPGPSSSPLHPSDHRHAARSSGGAAAGGGHRGEHRLQQPQQQQQQQQPPLQHLSREFVQQQLQLPPHQRRFHDIDNQVELTREERSEMEQEMAASAKKVMGWFNKVEPPDECLSPGPPTPITPLPDECLAFEPNTPSNRSFGGSAGPKGLPPRRAANSYGQAGDFPHMSHSRPPPGGPDSVRKGPPRASSTSHADRERAPKDARDRERELSLKRTNSYQAPGAPARPGDGGSGGNPLVRSRSGEVKTGMKKSSTYIIELPNKKDRGAAPNATAVRRPSAGRSASEQRPGRRGMKDEGVRKSKELLHQPAERRLVRSLTNVKKEGGEGGLTREREDGGRGGEAPAPPYKDHLGLKRSQSEDRRALNAAEMPTRDNPHHTPPPLQQHPSRLAGLRSRPAGTPPLPLPSDSSIPPRQVPHPQVANLAAGDGDGSFHGSPVRGAKMEQSSSREEADADNDLYHARGGRKGMRDDDDSDDDGDDGHDKEESTHDEEDDEQGGGGDRGGDDDYVDYDRDEDADGVDLDVVEAAEYEEVEAFATFSEQGGDEDEEEEEEDAGQRGSRGGAYQNGGRAGNGGEGGDLQEDEEGDLFGGPDEGDDGVSDEGAGQGHSGNHHHGTGTKAASSYSGHSGSRQSKQHQGKSKSASAGSGVPLLSRPAGNVPGPIKAAAGVGRQGAQHARADSYGSGTGSVGRGSSSSWPNVLGRPLEVLEEKYVLLDTVLGKGYFGDVVACRHKQTGDFFACKIIKKENVRSPEDVEDVRNEVSALEMLRGHENIVNLVDTVEDSENVYVVMELCEGGSLQRSVRKHGPFPEEQAALICHAVVSAIHSCHGCGVLHRDVKPDNVVLVAAASAGRDRDVLAGVKLVDFGISAFFEPGHPLTEIVGSASYIAPEMISQCYSSEVDVWGAGVLLYFVLSGYLPFHAATKEAVFEAILDGRLNFRSPPWNNISLAAKDLISRMLTSEPSERITTDEILAHPWVSGAL